MRGPEEKGGQFQVLERDNALLESLTEEERKYFEGKGINTIQNKRVWERFKTEVLPGLKMADRSFLENCREPLSFNVDAFEKPFLKPTLMLAGRQDSIVGYRGIWKLLDLYPRASFVLLDKAAHNLQIEQEHLFTETVKEWLNRVTIEMGSKGD